MEYRAKTWNLSAVLSQMESMYEYIDDSTEKYQFDNLVESGVTVSCHYNSLLCHPWRKNCQTGYLVFSVMYNGLLCLNFNITLWHIPLCGDDRYHNDIYLTMLVVDNNKTFSEQQTRPAHISKKKKKSFVERVKLAKHEHFNYIRLHGTVHKPTKSQADI